MIVTNDLMQSGGQAYETGGKTKDERIAELEAELAEAREQLAFLEGEGFLSAIDTIREWWSEANIRGTAEMSGDEMVELCENIQQSMREARALAGQGGEG